MGRASMQGASTEAKLQSCEEGACVFVLVLRTSWDGAVPPRSPFLHQGQGRSWWEALKPPRALLPQLSVPLGVTWAQKRDSKKNIYI